MIALRWLFLISALVLLKSDASLYPVKFTVPGISVSPTNTIDLPVSIQTNGNNVGSLEFALNYDQSILQFSKITISEEAQKWLTYTMDGGDGKVRWGGYDTTYGTYSITNPTELFIISFTVLNENWSTTPITIGRKTAGDAQGWDIPVSNTDGYINRTNIPLDEDGIRGVVYPVPTNDLVSVNFTVPESETYQINLFDLKGTLLKSTNKIFIKGANSYTESLSSNMEGIYLLQLKSSKFIKTFKLIKN
jgi:hypothetical protein